MVTLFVINMRYFFMSFSVSQKLAENFPIRKRLITGFGITDEIFAVSMQREKELTFPYVLGLMLTPIVGWTLGTLTGAVANSILPTVLTDAMGIALYAMFIAIIVPSAKEEKNVLIAVVMAIVASYLFTYLPGIRNLSSGWATIIITVSVSLIAAVIFPVEEKEAE
jgi:predicted branched-subunit amino acid permease